MEFKSRGSEYLITEQQQSLLMAEPDDVTHVFMRKVLPCRGREPHNDHSQKPHFQTPLGSFLALPKSILTHDSLIPGPPRNGGQPGIFSHVSDAQGVRKDLIVRR